MYNIFKTIIFVEINFYIRKNCSLKILINKTYMKFKFQLYLLVSLLIKKNFII